MNAYLLILVFISTIISCTAYDIFQGLGQQMKPCFEVFNYPQCKTNIPAVFTPIQNKTILHEPDTKVWLFTLASPDKAEPLHECGGELPSTTTFDPQIETIVLIHGWLDGVCRTGWMRETKNELIKRGNCNIILVDWTWGNTVDLAVAAFNGVAVGQQVGFVIKNIMRKMKINGKKFHFIGHSFGAYAASFGAKFVKLWDAKKKIRRVTALDPGIVPFREENAEENIHYTDADFVDVYHTSAGTCFPFDFGNREVLGHIDFYINGGRYQPSCVSYMGESLIKGDLLYGLLSLIPPFCNHLQAVQLFKVTINPPNGLVVGVECDNEAEFFSGVCKRCCKEPGYECAVAGMDAEQYFPHKDEPRKKRKYYYKTENFCPFNENYNFSIYKDCKDN